MGKIKESLVFMSKNNNSKKKSRAFPVILKIIGTAVIAVCLVISLAFALPRVFGYEMYNVISGSMEPTIPVGSMIYVKHVEGESVKTGDVIAFVSGSSVITHRVTENDTERRELSTKGDANELEDFTKVSYLNLIGVVKLAVPRLGIWGGYFSSLTGKIYLIAAIAFGFIINVIGDKLDPKQETEKQA